MNDMIETGFTPFQKSLEAEGHIMKRLLIFRCSRHKIDLPEVSRASVASFLV